MPARFRPSPATLFSRCLSKPRVGKQTGSACSDNCHVHHKVDPSLSLEVSGAQFRLFGKICFLSILMEVAGLAQSTLFQVATFANLQLTTRQTIRIDGT